MDVRGPSEVPPKVHLPTEPDAPSPRPDDSITALVLLLIEHGDHGPLRAELLARLESYASSLHDQAERARLFAQCSLAAGRDAAALAERLANRAFNCAERVDDPGARVHVLGDLALRFHAGGDIARAHEAGERAAILNSELPLGEARKRAILEVGSVLGRIEGVDRGIDWVEPLAAAARERPPELAAQEPTDSLESPDSIEDFSRVNGAALAPDAAPHEPAGATDGDLAAPIVHHHSRRRRRRH